MAAMLTAAQSRARIKKLRTMGYKVKTVTLPNGDRVILKSRKRFVCTKSHCARS